jgi:voltage-gated potassium channel
MALKPADVLDDITPYQLFMLALCIFALALLGAGALLRLDGSTSTILEYADNVVCGLFLVDFVLCFWRAPNKLRYMLTWGWIDLLSSIPALDAFRLGRAARLLRIVRLLRAIRSVRILGHFIISKREQSMGLAAGLAALLLVVFSSIGVLQFEVPAGGNIQSAEDAAWWSITTMTTVGYGDKYPTTSEGRLIAVILMGAGICLVGVLSGMVASWFLSPAAHKAEAEREELKVLIGQLREQVAGLTVSLPALSPTRYTGRNE